MRTMLILLFIFIGQTFAIDSFSQNNRLSLKMADVSIRNVLNEIENQTDYYFMYEASKVDVNKKTQIAVNNRTIEEVLDELFLDSDIIYIINNRQIALSTEKAWLSTQQSKEISGVVTDGAGLPLPGVTVMVKGTTTGTITNDAGEYTLKEVRPGVTLMFSFVGMRSYETIVGSNAVVNVILEEETFGIEEVIAVGYGVQKKVNLTGAVEQVTSEILEDRPVANVQQAIQGVLPSMNFSVGSTGGEPGSSMAMNIRGVGSLDGTDAPYILVDGVPVNSINDINPNDIESISVLKDAASAAIYGARAAYGVVLITTKGGKEGVHVSYSNVFTYSAPLKLPEMMNSLEFANYFNQAGLNDGDSAPVFSDEIMGRIEQYMKDPTSIDGTFPEPGNPDRWGAYMTANANTNWFDVFYKDWTPRQTHTVSVSGKKDKVDYYVSGGFYDEKGLLKYGDDEYKRYTMNSKVSSEVNSYLSLRANVKYTRGVTDRPSYDRYLFYHNIARRWPTNPLYTPDGDYHQSSEIPYLLSGRSNSTSDNFLISTGAILEPIKDWKINFDYNWTVQSNIGNNHYGSVILHGPEGVTYTERPNTSYSASASKKTYSSPNIYSSYEKEFDSGHTFKVLTGFQQELEQYEWLYASKQGLITDEVPSISTATSEQDDVGDSKWHWATRGFFGRLNYNFEEKYLLEVNARYDGSSKFPGDERWGLFPSVSVGYNLAREDFFNVEQIDILKIRGSWGALGNQLGNKNEYLYLYVPTIPVSTNNWWIMGDSRPNYASLPGLISPTLTWAKVKTKNVGVDWGIFNNQLTGSLDVFERYTSDLPGPAEALPGVLGTSVPKINNTELQTNGFELVIGWEDKINEFSYHAKATLSNAKTKVAKYRNPTGILTTYYEGQELGEIWGYVTEGIAQDDAAFDDWYDQSKISGQEWRAGDIMYQDLNDDGVIDWGDNTVENPGDKKIIGNSTPQYQFALSAGGKWKGIDFSMLWTGVAKRDLAIGGSYFWGGTGGVWQSAGFKAHLDYWSEDNPDAYYPRPYLTNGGKNQQVQTRYLQNGAYLRLKNVQLGYTLPEMFVKKLQLSKVRFYVTGENLFVLTDLIDIFDPETTGGSWGAGKIYPLQKSFAFGMNVSF
ncbi:TonB-dependent receptor [Sunxiuqinia rutila]|uniref:TonB-dependent receptor n=1 Tax=Sunxiuqinia rutila TaxID=1397841 RepID=UPI003D36CA80